MTRVVLPPLLLTGEAPPRVHALAAARYGPLLPFVIDGDSVLQQTLPTISSQGRWPRARLPPLSADRTLPPAQAILAPALRPDQPLNQRPLLPPVHVYSPSNGYRPRTSHADQPFGPQAVPLCVKKRLLSFSNAYLHVPTKFSTSLALADTAGQPQGQLIVANMALIADYLISSSKIFPYMTLFCDMGSKKFIQAYIFFKSNLIYAFGFLF
ncbi:unnamed protein product [Miscanthus lutarioriparius]|uniref:Uncharacterized protein n=1 Tax=Miscanthus lutarioriparius TaxID=422564 RepID=A0A811MY10_9POAL|nr:unnamed protein product [Miscanthus lutarioriparius]